MKQVAIVDVTGKVPFDYLQRVATALTTQLERDFDPHWDETALVTAYETIAEIPTGHWPIYVQDEIELAGAYGFHWYTDEKLPYAEILYRANWTITASHELLEMMVNPFINNYRVADISAEFEGDERFLVEVAGPVQSPKFGYKINNILVSNFFYPSYFDLLKVTGKKYDHLGVITEPRSILEGGYVSFLDNLGKWWQAFKTQGIVDIYSLTGEKKITQESKARTTRTIIYIFSSISIVFIIYNIIKHELITIPRRRSGIRK